MKFKIEMESPEKNLLVPVLKKEIKRLENYLLDNEKSRDKNSVEHKDNYRLWGNYFEKENELKVLNRLLTQLIQAKLTD